MEIRPPRTRRMSLVAHREQIPAAEEDPAAVEDLAGRIRYEPEDGHCADRLPAAGLPDDRDGLSLAHVVGDAVDGLYGALRGVEPGAKILDFEQLGHGDAFGTCGLSISVSDPCVIIVGGVRGESNGRSGRVESQRNSDTNRATPCFDSMLVSRIRRHDLDEMESRCDVDCTYRTYRMHDSRGGSFQDGWPSAPRDLGARPASPSRRPGSRPTVPCDGVCGGFPVASRLADAFLPSRLATSGPRLVLGRPRRPRRSGRSVARAPAAVGAGLRAVADPDRRAEERVLRGDDGGTDSFRARLRTARRTPSARPRNVGDRGRLAAACRGGRISGPAPRGAGGRNRIERAASARFESGEPRAPGRPGSGRARHVQLRGGCRQGRGSRPARRRDRDRRVADVVDGVRHRDGDRRARCASVAATIPVKRDAVRTAHDRTIEMGASPTVATSPG